MNKFELADGWLAGLGSVCCCCCLADRPADGGCSVRDSTKPRRRTVRADTILSGPSWPPFLHVRRTLLQLVVPYLRLTFGLRLHLYVEKTCVLFLRRTRTRARAVINNESSTFFRAR
jgi:hypothetical protein